MNKTYSLLLVDPPYFYNKRNKGTKFGAGIWGHYKGMKLPELLAMRPFIDTLADDNCLLAMWTTGARLEQTMLLIPEWGFRYATMGFVWIKTAKSTGKPRILPGNYTSQSTELCLFGVRGSMLPKQKLVAQVVLEPAREHSRKPACVRHRLEQMYPDTNKIELFARQEFEGWDSWGDEVGKFKE